MISMFHNYLYTVKMDNEKLKRANELAETIKIIKDFLEVFPKDVNDVVQCQIKISYNVPLVCTVKEQTIWAGDIPSTFWTIKDMAKQELSKYEKEFKEL